MPSVAQELLGQVFHRAQVAVALCGNLGPSEKAADPSGRSPQQADGAVQSQAENAGEGTSG